MRKALLIPLILLALVSCVLLVGSQSTVMPTITSVTQSGTLYHVFDDKDAQAVALDDALMNQTYLTREPLMRKEDLVRIWFGEARLYFTHEGQVIHTATGVTKTRQSKVAIRYIDEAVENLKALPGGQTVAMMSGKWAFIRKTYEPILETAQRTVAASPTTRLLDVADQPDLIHFIRVTKTKSELNYNDAFYSIHAERYDHCIIEITIDGYWRDDAAFKAFLQSVIEHAHVVARRAEARAADCHRLFPAELVTIPEEPTPTPGKAPTATPTPKATETSSKEWDRLSGTLLFNIKDPDSQSANQRLILGIFDSKGVLVDTVETKTDGQGRFIIQAPIREGDLLKISAPLSYHTTDGEMLMGVYDDRVSGDMPLVVACGGGEIRVKSDTRLDDLKLSLMEGKVLSQSNQAVDTVNAVVFYGMMADGISFYADQLQVRLEYALPLRLILFSQTRTPHPRSLAYYSTADGDIRLYPETSDAYLGSHPDILYHELAHAVMYDVYDRQFPSRGTADSNHGGYANSSSADSFIEGFADFMAAVVASINGDSRKRAELEINELAWQNNGLSEECAIAGTLLDLWDGGKIDDDSISFDVKQMWSLLKDYCPDFKSFYQRLNAFFGKTDHMDQINQVFISHGIYEVTDKLADGAGSYQAGEAFRDNNHNDIWDPGEFFVDFNAAENGMRVMVFKPEYKPGWSAYPDNPSRNYSPIIPWHSIKTSDKHRYFEAKVTFPNHSELNYTLWPDNFGGLIYLQMPPAEYGATVTISRRNYADKQTPLTYTAAEFYKVKEQTMRNGYFREHDFDAKSPLVTILLIAIGVMIAAAVIWYLTRSRRKRA